MLKRKYLLLLLIISILLITSCANENTAVGVNNKNSSNEAEDNYYTFTDSLENTVVLKEKPEKVVALVGSYAETWLLAGGELAGVTDDVITERKMDVSENTKIVGTIKDPNLEEILSLEPDFILLSPDIESHTQISETLKKAQIPHAYFKIEQFEDYLNMLDICTDITGSKDLYEKNGLKVQKQIEDVISKIDTTSKPSVLFIRAFSSGAKAKDDVNMTCKILNDLSTVNIASEHQSLLEDLSIEEIIEEDPDYIFVTTMGDTDKAIKAMKNGIEKNLAWKNLTAVKNDRYIVLPKDLFHYKPNARWGESYEYLAKIIYPNSFK